MVRLTLLIILSRIIDIIMVLIMGFIGRLSRAGIVLVQSFRLS